MPWEIIALPALLSFAFGFWKGLNANVGAGLAPARHTRKPI